MNHGLKCDKTHNLDGLLMYDEEKNDEFVKEAQENLSLMEKEMQQQNAVGEGVVGGSGAGFESFPYVDFGELSVLDENHFPPMIKYSYLPLRKMRRRTGLILDLPHHQVGEKSHFMKHQFVGTRFNVNGLRSIEPSERRCEYRAHNGDVRLVGIDTDQDTVCIK